MSHKLFRLKSKVCNTPQLVTDTVFNQVLEYLDGRNFTDAKLEVVEDTNTKYGNSIVLYEEDKVAIVNIEGVLTYKPMFDMATCGENTNYSQLKGDFEQLALDGYKTVVMQFDSGGGEAHGCFDSARYIKSIATEYNIKLISLVDGIAASAAYVLASISDEVYATKGSSVGSVGVVVQLMNNSKQLEKQGIERRFVYSGSNKVPFENDGSFKESFIKKIQKDCDSLFSEFVEHVSTQRNLSLDAVRNLEADTFSGEEAMSLGLIDGLCTVEEFYDALERHATNVGVEEEKAMRKYKLFGGVAEMQKVEQQEMGAEVAATTEMSVSQSGEVATLSAHLETTTVLLKEAQEMLSTKDAELASMKTMMAEFEAFKAEKAEQEVLAKMAAREEKLSAFLAKDKVEATMSTTASMDDTSFETLLSVFESQYSASLASKDFEQVSDGGNPEKVAKTVEEHSLDATLQYM